MAGLIDDDHGIRRGFEQIAHLLLRFLAIGDVAHRRRREAAFFGVQRRQADLDRELGAILSAAPELQPGTHLANFWIGEITLAVADVLVVQTRRYEDLHRLVYQRITREAEQALGLGVDQFDRPALVDDDHRVWRGFEQIAHLLLRFLAIGDVADGRRGEPAFVGFQRRQADFDGELAAVLAATRQFQSGPHLAHFRINEIAAAMGQMLITQGLGHQHLDRTADQRLPLVAEHALGLGVDQFDHALAVDDDHRIGRCFEQVLELRFGRTARGGVADRSRRKHAAVGAQRTQADLDRKLGAILAHAG